MRVFPVAALSLALLVTSAAGTARGHCQIPCGIYDDAARLAELKEHIATIEKSMRSVTELSAKEQKDYNQIVRWVVNKDEHAGFIDEIVSYYFLTQRVKPVADPASDGYAAYIAQVTALHELLVASMQAKQSTDLAVAGRMRDLVARFEESYMGSQKK